MSDENLLPCPFCGSSDVSLFAEINGEARDVFVFCKQCDSIAGYGRCHVDFAAVKLWNARAQSSDSKRLDWLEKNLHNLTHARATCSAFMGGQKILGQLCLPSKTSGPRKFRVYHHTIREAIDDAMKEDVK